MLRILLLLLIAPLLACAAAPKAERTSPEQDAGCSQYQGAVRCLCTETHDLEVLAEPGAVSSIDIAELAETADLSVLARFPRLRELRIGVIRPAQTSALNSLSRVEVLGLTVDGGAGHASLAFVGGMSGLRVLDVKVVGNTTLDDADLSGIASLAHLKVLHIRRMTVWDFAPLGGLGELEAITIQNAAGTIDLAPLAKLPRLRSLGLAGRYRVVDRAVLDSSKSLETVHVKDAPNILTYEEAHAPRSEPTNTIACDIDTDACRPASYCHRDR